MSSASGSGNLHESQLTKRLLDLTRATNYELVQENGQRRLTAPEFTIEMKEKLKGSEIFIGRLPRDCYEDEIMPILQNIGRLLELRLMLDFSGSTRGYAFALFESPAIARQACRALDGYEIRPGRKIGVVTSIDNCRLFFGGVPKDKTKEDFLNELGKLLDGITNIYVYPNSQDKTQNRGFIFVEFKDHRAAAMARRKLIPGRVILWNHEIAVDWADPEPGEPIDNYLMETISALFVRNLALDAHHHRIREIFQKATNIPILKVKKINHFAFVHYENRQQAQSVLDTMTKPGGIAEQNQWEIRWAKPLNSYKSTERRNFTNVAITGGNADAPKRSIFGSKIIDHKKSLRKINQEKIAMDFIRYANYPLLLTKFVAEKFNAVCSFQCYPNQDGFICKVTGTRGSEVIFVFESQRFPSEKMAFEYGAFDIFHHMNDAVENFKLQPLTECNERGPLYKFEACRS
ncbi:probable RNA-binding protein 46 [Venturia canescens]|uniref:probable RNA-binding protein 46 n=1 Tax=Venturia canescens TaxID=32260 RepID=UPI001C9C38B0|nr:probable RNA-binding protein 46 [Venturia canescens]